jgi:WD40 repeat protein
MRLFLWEITRNGEVARTKKLSSVRFQREIDQRIMALDVIEELVAAADSGGQISLFQIQAKGLGAQLSPLNTFTVKPLSCILCLKLFELAELRYIVIGTTAGYICVYQTEGGVLISQLKAHQLGVNCISFSYLNQDQITIITGGDDQSIAISSFHLPNSLTLCTSNPTAHYSAIKAIQQVGNSLLSVSWDGYLKLWSLPHLSLIACTPHFIGDCSSIAVLDGLVVVAGLGLEWFHLSTLMDC